VPQLLTFIIAGLVSGAVYGLAGVGLVIGYKTSGVFNFAYGSLASVAAYLVYSLNVQLGWPMWAAVILAVPVLGVLLGWCFEPFGRRVSAASLNVQVAATVGLLLTISSIETLKYGVNPLQFPAILPTNSFKVGSAYVQMSQVIIFAVSLLGTALVYFFLRLTRTGIAMRAVVENPSLVDTSGISGTWLRRHAWTIACFSATLTGILLAPSVGLDPTTLTLLVIYAFGAAAIGRFTSLPFTWLGGLAIGVAASILTKYVNSSGILSGLPASLPFIVLFVSMLVFSGRRFFVASAAPRALHRSMQALPLSAQLAGAAAVLALLCIVPSFAGAHLGGWTVALVDIMLLLSLGLLVRTAGYASLCVITFAAVGAVAFSKLSGAGLPWLPALLLGALAVVPIGALLAIPAMRLGGIFLAIATFGFGLLMQDMFYDTSWMFGTSGLGILMPMPHIASIDFESGNAFYYLVLVATVLVAVTVTWLTRSRLGRLLRAMSESRAALAAGGTSLITANVLVFCIAAYLAAIAGAFLGMQQTVVTGASYDPMTSLTLFAVVVVSIGGAPWFAVPAGLGLGLIPEYVTWSSSSTYLTLLFGVTAVAVGLQGGMSTPQWMTRLAEHIRAFGGRRQQPGTPDEAGGATKPLDLTTPRARNGDMRSPVPPRRPSQSPAATGPTLEVEGLTVRFGGHTAVSDLTVAAPVGRVTGLIGPNGAGKTTTFNACSGFIRTGSGRVRWKGRDVSGKGPAARARMGLGRSFQRMELYESMTVAENVALGYEAALAGANVGSQMFALPGQRREAQRRAMDALALTAIAHLADRIVHELSTGERRLVELARGLAGPAELLLLDEPSSGLDRLESRAFGQVITSAMSERPMGVFLVEHDMSVVMGICDYVYVLDFGELIYEGTPDAIRTSEVVQAAYLGTDAAAATPDTGRAEEAWS
jgi:ABC-type branched-subunit amino acid transport system ATPase component/branched-subunit amino acid ABC-type transport system permease component